MVILGPAPPPRRLRLSENARHALLFAGVMAAALGLVLFLGGASALSLR